MDFSKYPTEKILLMVISLLFIVFITLVTRQAVLTYQPRAALQQGDLNIPTSPPTTPGVTSPPAGGCEPKKLHCRTRIKGIRKKQQCQVCTYQLADCSKKKTETCVACGGGIIKI